MVSLESKLAFLRQPGSYPEPVCRVETVESHMSWIFLTDRYAYKLKKPVRHGLLDFSTVDARRFFCEEELRLNRRLAPDVYLSTVALVIDAQEHLRLAGEGAAVDWLVRMRRLPAQRMLDAMISTKSAQAGDMKRIAALLADFYRNCTHIDLDCDHYRARFERDIEQNRTVLCDPSYRLPIERIGSICAVQQAWLAHSAGLLDERVGKRSIVEGHGDLRAEHVCLEDKPVIIDCLEFSRELRIADAADELSFLRLECERLGAPHLGDMLLNAYRELTGDAPPDVLIHFYQSVRAGLRARIAISHLDEEQFRHSAKWPRRAMEYLQLAERHAQAARVIPDRVSPAATR